MFTKLKPCPRPLCFWVKGLPGGRAGNSLAPISPCTRREVRRGDEYWSSVHTHLSQTQHIKEMLPRVAKSHQATVFLCLISTLPWRWPEHSSFFKICADMHLKNLNNHTWSIKPPPCGNIPHLPVQRRCWKRVVFLTVNCTSPLHSPLEREI